jgi:hypothetical protein
MKRIEMKTEAVIAQTINTAFIFSFEDAKCIFYDISSHFKVFAIDEEKMKIRIVTSVAEAYRFYHE